jgi:hypothetical protein
LPQEQLAGWLDESYGWPKDDFYWWTLAQLKRDESLTRNFRQDPGQLFTVNSL